MWSKDNEKRSLKEVSKVQDPENGLTQFLKFLPFKWTKFMDAEKFRANRKPKLVVF